ncbi:MAG: NAD(P)-dependent oxidoreductase [Ruthenibacterium lactatiformans]
MKIVILDGYTENPGDLSWNGFEALGEVTVYDRTPFADGSGGSCGGRRGGYPHREQTPLSAETLAKLAPELRYIGVLATGYNVVDTAAASAGRARVQYPNLRHCGGGPVCDGVAAGAVPPCGDHSRSVKRAAGAASGLLLLEYVSHRAGGQDVRRYRLRRIGRAAAKLAAAFGMEVLAFDKFAQDDGVARMVTLDELLAQSDDQPALPAVSDTQGIINRESIAKMKDGVLLINTSAGP